MTVRGICWDTLSNPTIDLPSNMANSSGRYR